MYTITKEFSFDAAHKLTDLPLAHPCSHIHGHTYTVSVELRSGKVDETGMVLDYRKLEPVKKFIDTTLDHTYLNDKVPFNPTAENLACWIYNLFTDAIPQLTAVTVKETPKTAARYEFNPSDVSL